MAATAGDSPDDGSVSEGSDTPEVTPVSLPEADLAPDTAQVGEADVLSFHAQPALPLDACASDTPPLSLVEPVETLPSSLVELRPPAAAVETPALPTAPAPAVPAPTDAAAVTLDFTAPPGPELISLLSAQDPVSLSGREILDGIAGLDRVLSWVTGLQQTWMNAACTPGLVVNKDTAAAMVEVREGIDWTNSRTPTPTGPSNLSSSTPSAWPPKK